MRTPYPGARRKVPQRLQQRPQAEMPGSVVLGAFPPPLLSVLRERVHAALHYLAPRKACRGVENRSPIVGVGVVVVNVLFFVFVKIFRWIKRVDRRKIKLQLRHTSIRIHLSTH